MEAMGEIEDKLEVRQGVTSSTVECNATEEDQTEAVVRREAPKAQVPSKRTVVADSEDEEEDEMLIDDEAAYAAQTVLSAASSSAPKPGTPQREPGQAADEGKLSFILIDNLSHILNPLLKKDYIHGLLAVPSSLSRR